MTTWVIGAGGLFGSALLRKASQPFIGAAIPWDDSAKALQALVGSLEDFSKVATEEWCIAWAAGRATTSSSFEESQRELDLFHDFVRHLAEHTPPGKGTFLVTSSAGGVYAGSSSPPFTSASRPEPISNYGRLKLDQERIADQTLSQRMNVTIARLSNLYGPGQDLRKLQGLVSRLALAAITKQPLSIFVPLDTLRDYIYADDAAVQALSLITRNTRRSPQAQVRLIASGESVSVGTVISLMNDVTRSRIPIAYGLHGSASAQAHDLRLIPDCDIDSFTSTPLPVGMKNVYLDLLQRHATADLVN